jgi:preprotein translocase SecE subunit
LSTQIESRQQASLQLGVQKYLYTGFFVGGIFVAWFVYSAVDRLWEGHDTASTAIGVAAGILAVILAWRHEGFRTLSREVIDELAAVTWPTRQETQTATTIVLTTAVAASAGIFLIDRFWGLLTDWLFK